MSIFLNHPFLLSTAHDHGAEFTGTYGTDGRFFGRFLEGPIPFLSAWTLFGAASFLNLESDGPGARQYIILAICILQGVVAGIFIQTALMKADLAGKNKWSVGFVLLFLALAITIGINKGSDGLLALALSLFGAILIILGQKTVFGDRLRGDFFMEHPGETNPNPIVYSYGELLFMTGWIAISLGMSLPM